ncbi:MAG TPA: hypothetical protein DCX80_06585 [Chloroflexi bacterium]|nr:hypothetical protein [Chloroflexota bacterium]
MTDPWGTVVIATPTVSQRSEIWAETRRAWEQAGVRQIVATLQPTDWPLGHKSQRRTADDAVADALERYPEASHVLYAEDDILIDPAITRRLPGLLGARVPITLFVAGTRHYPASIRRTLDAGQALAEAVIPITGQRAWVGSLAVLLPRGVAEASTRWESRYTGWDVHIREFLRAHGRRLCVAVPNLVQHRDIESMTGSPRGAVSVTFGQSREDT